MVDRRFVEAADALRETVEAEGIDWNCPNRPNVYADELAAYDTARSALAAEKAGRNWTAREIVPGGRWEVVCRDAAYYVTFDQCAVAMAVAETLTRMESVPAEKAGEPTPSVEADMEPWIAVQRAWQGLDTIMVEHGLDKKATPEEAQAWLRERLASRAEPLACPKCSHPLPPYSLIASRAPAVDVDSVVREVVKHIDEQGDAWMHRVQSAIGDALRRALSPHAEREGGK